MSFTLSQIYSCTREKYLQETGITAEMLIVMLEAEVKMLNKSYKRIQADFRTRKVYSSAMLEETLLLGVIERKIARKNEKIKDLKNLKG